MQALMAILKIHTFDGKHSDPRYSIRNLPYARTTSVMYLWLTFIINI